MKTITVLKSYYANGKIEKNQFDCKVKDLNKFFNERIQDAQVYANIRGGNVQIDRTEKTLYINYANVPNTNKCDNVYIVQENLTEEQKEQEREKRSFNSIKEDENRMIDFYKKHPYRNDQKVKSLDLIELISFFWELNTGRFSITPFSIEDMMCYMYSGHKHTIDLINYYTPEKVESLKHRLLN